MRSLRVSHGDRGGRATAQVVVHSGVLDSDRVVVVRVHHDDWGFGSHLVELVLVVSVLEALEVIEHSEVLESSFWVVTIKSWFSESLEVLKLGGFLSSEKGTEDVLDISDVGITTVDLDGWASSSGSVGSSVLGGHVHTSVVAKSGLLGVNLANVVGWSTCVNVIKEI